MKKTITKSVRFRPGLARSLEREARRMETVSGVRTSVSDVIRVACEKLVKGKGAR